MNVALVVPGGVDRSGRERVIPALLWLIERLARRHDVTVFALGQNDTPGDWPLLGAHVVDLGRAPRGPIPGAGIARRIAQLRGAIRKRRFDVAHAFWASPCGFVAAASFPRRTPLVVSLAGGELAAIPEIGYGRRLLRRERLKVAFTLRRASAVTAASGPMVAAAKSAGCAARLVPLGVEAAGFLPPGARGSDGALRLLHVASLNLVKDQTTLLHAFALARKRVPRMTLDVIGEDTLRGEIQKLADTIGVADAVFFHGWLPTDAVRQFLRRADVFVLSSRHEAGPVAVVEAAACCVPTAGTAVGHVADGHSQWTLAVPVGDANALAGAIVELAGDPIRRMRMGDAAYAWARENDADATAANFEAIYAEVSAKQAERPPRQNA